MSVKKFKFWLKREKTRALFIPLSISLLGIIGFLYWKTFIPQSLRADMPVLIKALLLAIACGAVLLPAFLSWGWYFSWFRYLAYGLAKLAGLIRKVFKNTFVQIVIVLALVTWAWVKRCVILGAEPEDFRNILRLSSIIEIVLVTAVVFFIKWLIVYRKRMFITAFKNHTGKTELDQAITGIPARLLNEMHKLTKLLRNIDEAQPKKEDELLGSMVDIMNVDKDFRETIGPEARVEFKGFIIPLELIATFFNKLIDSPILTGSVHRKGDGLVLTACLRGGRFKGSWEITVEQLKEIETPPGSRSDKVSGRADQVGKMTHDIVEMTDLLVCRIFTDIARGASPRWQAMKHYTDGLRVYRETLRTQNNRIYNLIEAKKAFGRAIRSDSTFVQCYYNFGIIYEKLDSKEAAEAAFREALKLDAENHHCYHELAYHYYGNENFLEADWFCRQALAICPIEPRYWNLCAVIRYYKWYETAKDNYRDDLPVPGEVVQYFGVATALAWKDLCKEAIGGEIKVKTRYIAGLCTRNLAIITGEMKEYRSRFLFGQALFLDPDNNDLHFELGKYYFRRDELEMSRGAFTRVFEHDAEVNDPFSYWGFYLSVNAALQYRKDLDIKDKDIDNIYRHFLAAVADIIHNRRKPPEKLAEKINLFNKVVLKSLYEIDRKYDGHIIKYFLENIEYLSQWDHIARFVVLMNVFAFREYLNLCSGDFARWYRAQIRILISRYIIDKKIVDGFEMATGLLNEAKYLIEKDYQGKLHKYRAEIKTLEICRYLAEGYFGKEQYEKALNFAREAVRLDPYNKDIRLILGKILVQLKDYDAAIKEFEVGLNLDQRDPADIKEFLKEIAGALIKKGETCNRLTERQETFKQAEKHLKLLHDIVEDKSSKDEDGETDDNTYFLKLYEVHFNLDKVSKELGKKDEADNYHKIAQEMRAKLNANVELTKRLVELTKRLEDLWAENQG